MDAIRLVLKYIGEDPDRERLINIPKRIVRAFDEHFGGYKVDPKKHFETTFEKAEGYYDLVILTDIPFESNCEHHIAPIIGTVSISYLPNGRVVGISKLA